jgi:hypothetical protein
MHKAAQLGRVLIGQRRPRMILIASVVLYLLMYLYAIGDINVRAYPGLADAYLVSEPLSTMLERRAALYFEAIAVVSLPYLTWLLAPINLLIGGLLGLLVGINMSLGDLAWRQPRACRIGAGGGMLAAVPGLLAGSACCAPTLLLVLGIPASASLLSLFSLMVPLALALLVLSLVLLGRQVDAEAAAHA